MTGRIKIMKTDEMKQCFLGYRLLRSGEPLRASDQLKVRFGNGDEHWLRLDDPKMCRYTYLRPKDLLPDACRGLARRSHREAGTRDPVQAAIEAAALRLRIPEKEDELLLGLRDLGCHVSTSVHDSINIDVPQGATERVIAFLNELGGHSADLDLANVKLWQAAWERNHPEATAWAKANREAADKGLSVTKKTRAAEVESLHQEHTKLVADLTSVKAKLRALEQCNQDLEHALDRMTKERDALRNMDERVNGRRVYMQEQYGEEFEK